MARQKPIHQIRVGLIRAAVWQNDSEDRVPRFNVSITRAYKQGEEWKESRSFARDDLPVVAKLADLAFAWIVTQCTDSQAAEYFKNGEPF